MRLPSARVVLRPLVYLWAFPTTLLGLLLAGLSLASRGRVARVAGTIEVHGGWASHLLERLMPRGADALTLGHVVVGQDAGSLERQREHERVHVRQCERWGPLFVPAYACASLWAWARGGDPYLDNPFEREVSEHAGPPRRPDSSRAL
jgi:hypothetical protein